jgi:hypothetical protein
MAKFRERADKLVMPEGVKKVRFVKIILLLVLYLFLS